MRIKKIIKIFITIVIVVIAIMIIAIIITMIFDKTINMIQEQEKNILLFCLIMKEDFDYVAKMMQQWPARSNIDFESGISNNNQEITDEISNNEEFYGHLKNLYNLKEIDYILVEGDEIAFYFGKFPSQYPGGVFYGENTRKENSTRRYIDDHWMLYMIPNT